MTHQGWRVRLHQAAAEAVRQIASGYDPEKIIVFGSVARGDVHEDSDIDLLVIKRTDRPFLQRIDDVLALVDVPISVQPLVYTPEELERLVRERRDFVYTALQEGRVVYERPHRSEPT